MYRYYHTRLFVNDGFNAQLPGTVQKFLKHLQDCFQELLGSYTKYEIKLFDSKFLYCFPPASTMDFTAEARMGHSTLLNITDVLVLATPAHEVHPAHLGLAKKR